MRRNTVSAGPAGSITKAGRISTSGRLAGMEQCHSLACQSRRPHSHPNQHTEAELKLIRDMRRRNPNLGMVELWHRLRQRGYTRRPESLFRVMKKLGLFSAKEKKPAYKPKPWVNPKFCVKSISGANRAKFICCGSRLSSVGNTDLAFVTLRSWRLNPSMALVV